MDDGRSGVLVNGLNVQRIKNADELLQTLSFGNKNRTQHPTDANAESSRSHAVFQVIISIFYFFLSLSDFIEMLHLTLFLYIYIY